VNKTTMLSRRAGILEPDLKLSSKVRKALFKHKLEGIGLYSLSIGRFASGQENRGGGTKRGVKEGMV